MIIGIDASRAFVKYRTGIEEYSYQVIKHLIPLLRDDQARLASTRRESRRVVLYLRKTNNLQLTTYNNYVKVNELLLPKNWKIKIIKWPYSWTQLGLSLEMLFHPVDVLFVPAHTVPFIHPSNTIVTIHGLEYEFCPQAYSFWEKLYMRFAIKNSCKWAKRIIAVSNNTKRDLMKLYKVPEGKIEVIYEGYDNQIQSSKFKVQSENSKFKIQDSKFLLFIGRLEERKNIVGIIKAFEILKEQYKLPHKLVLVGKFGYGEEKIKEEIRNVNSTGDIILPGYISEEEKWELLKNADVFLFPTFYEGFGLPILEAQSAGVPVVAGNNSSIPELVNLEARLLGAMLVDPYNAEEIADAAYKLISNKDWRDDIIKRGHENVKRFSWERCAAAIANVMLINK